MCLTNSQTHKFTNQKNMPVTTVIFLLAVAFLLWRMARWVLGTYQHPSEETLREFYHEQLDKSDLKRVREHLLHCDECRELLDEIRREPGKPQRERWIKKRF